MHKNLRNILFWHLEKLKSQSWTRSDAGRL